MSPFWQHLPSLCKHLILFFNLHKLFLVRIEHINRGNQGGKAPHGEGQFVGVQEVVEEAVDEIADESEGGTLSENIFPLSKVTHSINLVWCCIMVAFISFALMFFSNSFDFFHRF